MPVDQLIRLLADNAGTLGLALFAIWMLNKVWQARLDEERQHTQQMCVVWEQTRQALDNNTRVLTRLLERMRLVDDCAPDEWVSS